MKEKIELYREVLQQDPRSRAFFPLAEALQEAGLSREAARVLREGLQWHPDFLEARMLLVQILFAAGEREALAEVAAIACVLEKYPAFWAACAEWAGGERPDLTLPLRFLSAAFGHPGLGLEGVFERGLAALGLEPAGMERAHEVPESGMPRASAQPVSPASLHATREEGGMEKVPSDIPGQEEETPDTGEYPSFRTRSMANVLAEQGDFVGALEIYHELEGRTSDGEEREALRSCIRLLEKRMGSCASSDPERKDEERSGAEFPDSVELNDLLESLADRLEARARSGAPVMSGEF